MSEEKSLHSSPQLDFVEHAVAAVALSEKQVISLFKKSQQSGVPFDTLREVYCRGYLVDLSEQTAYNRVNSFIAGGLAAQMDHDLVEKRGLWDNIHAKQERIKHGSGEHMRRPGEKGRPTAKDLKVSQVKETIMKPEDMEDQPATKPSAKKPDEMSAIIDRMKVNNALDTFNSGVPNIIKQIKKQKNEAYSIDEPQSSNPSDPSSRFVGTDSLTNILKNDTPGQGRSKTLKTIKKVINEKKCCDDCECNVEEDKQGYKSESGGLTQKGRDHYNRESGGHLKAPVTTEPSKLKAGSKSANRRKSFCARMGGMKKRLTSAKTANDPDSRINKALRKWNC
jgi:hypothetical protein